MQPAAIDVLLIRWGGYVVGVAAEAVGGLTRPEEGETRLVPGLLESAGLPAPPGAREKRLVLHLTDEAPEGATFTVPAPFQLETFSLRALQPVSPLLRPLMRLRGVAGFALWKGRLVIVFDPLEVAREAAARRDS